MSKSPTLRPARARRLPLSYTHPRPMPGHTPHEAPTNVSHPRNCSPGPDPTHVEGCPLGLLRHSRSQQRTPPEPATHPTEASNGHYRTRQTHRQRLPQPHQLPTPNAPHRRRPRCFHPHPTMKNPICACLAASIRSGVRALLVLLVQAPVR